MIVITFVFIFLVLVFTWGFQLWKSRRVRRMIAHLPGPPVVPFVGNALEFLGSNKDILNTIVNLPQRYSTSFRIWLGNALYIATTNPAELQILCNSSKALSKPTAYKYLKPVGGNGLITASGPAWKKHRKLIMPTFNQKMLNSFVKIFAEQAEVMVRRLKKEVGGETFEAFRYLSPFALDLICETTMGVQVNAQIQESPFLNWINGVLEIAFKRIFHVWLRVDILFKLTGYAKQEKDALENIHGFIEKIIKQKKEEYMKHQEDYKHHLLEFDDGPKFLSTIDAMLNLLSRDNEFTDEELRDEVTTIVAAGSDTTAVSIGFVLLMLAMHQDHQETVYEEVIDVLGPDGTLHHEDLKRLFYTERVIKETLRIFPAVPAIARLADEDIRLESYTVPAGSAFVAGIIATHRDATLFPDPLKFDPDRFSPEEVAKRHPYSYIPFSAGPRNCIGMNYAMMQMKTTTAYLIRKYKVMTEYKSIGDVELKADLIIKPVRGYLISVKLRE